MKVMLGVILSILAIITGSSLWGVARTPRHLRQLLGNRTELERLVAYLGRDKLLAEAQTIKPVLGSYAANIAAFDLAHLKSLSNTRNALVLVAIGLIVGAFFVSSLITIIVLVLLLVPLSMTVPASAKNLNATHLHTVLLNIGKWHSEAPIDCAAYCTKERPDLAPAHEVLLGSSHRDT